MVKPIIKALLLMPKARLGLLANSNTNRLTDTPIPSLSYQEATKLPYNDDPRAAFDSPYSFSPSAEPSAVVPAVLPHSLVEPNQTRMSHEKQINTYVTGSLNLDWVY